MGVYIRAKFEVSSMILTSFRQGVILSPPTSKRTPKKPTQIRVKRQFSIWCSKWENAQWITDKCQLLNHSCLSNLGVFKWKWFSNIILFPLPNDSKNLCLLSITIKLTFSICLLHWLLAPRMCSWDVDFHLFSLISASLNLGTASLIMITSA